MPGTANVTITKQDNTEITWQCFVATTILEQSSGLAGLDGIDPESGMIFLFGASGVLNVTTEFMLFDIDVIFIDSNSIVTSVEHAVEPGNWLIGNGQAFLEVNSGEAVDIKIGDTVVVDYLQQEVDWMGPLLLIGLLGVTGIGLTALTSTDK